MHCPEITMMYLVGSAVISQNILLVLNKSSVYFEIDIGLNHIGSTIAHSICICCYLILSRSLHCGNLFYLVFLIYNRVNSFKTHKEMKN